MFTLPLFLSHQAQGRGNFGTVLRKVLAASNVPQEGDAGKHLIHKKHDCRNSLISPAGGSGAVNPDLKVGMVKASSPDGSTPWGAREWHHGLDKGPREQSETVLLPGLFS